MKRFAPALVIAAAWLAVVAPVAAAPVWTASWSVANPTAAEYANQILELPVTGAGLALFTGDLRRIRVSSQGGSTQMVEARSDATPWRLLQETTSPRSIAQGTVTVDSEDTTPLACFCDAVAGDATEMDPGAAPWRLGATLLAEEPELQTSGTIASNVVTAGQRALARAPDGTLYLAYHAGQKITVKASEDGLTWHGAASLYTISDATSNDLSSVSIAYGDGKLFLAALTRQTGSTGNLVQRLWTAEADVDGADMSWGTLSNTYSLAQTPNSSNVTAALGAHGVSVTITDEGYPAAVFIAAGTNGQMYLYRVRSNTVGSWSGGTRRSYTITGVKWATRSTVEAVPHPTSGTGRVLAVYMVQYPLSGGVGTVSKFESVSIADTGTPTAQTVRSSIVAGLFSLVAVGTKAHIVYSLGISGVSYRVKDGTGTWGSATSVDTSANTGPALTVSPNALSLSDRAHLLAYWADSSGDLRRAAWTASDGWATAETLTTGLASPRVLSPPLLEHPTEEAVALRSGNPTLLRALLPPPAGLHQAAMFKPGAYGLFVEDDQLIGEAMVGGTLAQVSSTVSPGLRDVELRHDGSVLELLVDGVRADVTDADGQVDSSTEDMVLTAGAKATQALRLGTNANEVADPSFEFAGTPLTDWTTSTSVATGAVARATTSSRFGAASLAATATQAAAGPDGHQGVYQDIAAAADEVWSVGASYQLIAQTGDGGAQLRVQFLDSSLAELAVQTLKATTATTGWARLSVLNQTAPANTAWLRIRLSAHTGGNGNIAVADFDGVQAVQGAALPGFEEYSDSLRWFGVLEPDEDDEDGSYTTDDLVSGVTATITRFRKSDAPEDVLATLTEFRPAAGYAVSTSTGTDSSSDVVSAAPGAPEGLYTEADSLTFPGGAMIEEAARVAGVPIALVAGLLGMVLVPGISIGSYIPTQSLLISGFATLLASAALALTTPIPLWVPIMIGIYVAAIYLLQRQRAV